MSSFYWTMFAGAKCTVDWLERQWWYQCYITTLVILGSWKMIELLGY